MLLLLAAACLHSSYASILLSEFNVQSTFSIVEDPEQPGFNIMGTIRWGNVSDNVPANNQISANGSFGSNQGLYKIDTVDGNHFFSPPTYTILEESFNIVYAEGVVNPPNDSDIFKFYFNLGDSVTSEDQAQNIVNALNHIISNPASFTGDQPFLIQRHINGLVHGGGIPKEFENSPQVYVIPEPVTSGLLAGLTRRPR